MYTVSVHYAQVARTLRVVARCVLSSVRRALSQAMVPCRTHAAPAADARSRHCPALSRHKASSPCPGLAATTKIESRPHKAYGYRDIKIVSQHQTAISVATSKFVSRHPSSHLYRDIKTCVKTRFVTPTKNLGREQKFRS